MGPNFDKMVLIGGPLSELCPMTPPANQGSRHSFNIGPCGENVLKSSLKLHGLLGPNFDGMVRRWSPFRIVSDDPAQQPMQSTSTDSFNIGPMGKMF